MRLFSTTKTATDLASAGKWAEAKRWERSLLGVSAEHRALEHFLAWGLFWILALLCLIVGVLACLAPSQAKPFVAEGGLVENLSAALLATAVIVASLKTWRSRSLVWGAAALVLLGLFLREMDYQKLFTPRSIESIGFYSSQSIPLSIKLVALGALAPFAAAGLFLVLAASRAVRNTPAPVRPWLVPALVAVGLLGSAQLSEKFLPARFHVVEETSELAFAAVLVLVVVGSALDLGRSWVASPPVAPNSRARESASPSDK
jgi:hypothetical protein